MTLNDQTYMELSFDFDSGSTQVTRTYEFTASSGQGGGDEGNGGQSESSEDGGSSSEESSSSGDEGETQ